MASSATSVHHEPSKSEIRMVIAASSAGTVFEWYDFFIYGTLAVFISQAFFPTGNETLSLLLAWAGFAIGFGFRPLGAILFGYLGDKLGRKYTFLVTVTLMGIATAGVGFVPSVSTLASYDAITIGSLIEIPFPYMEWVPPLTIIVLRIAQGLALGGEYGGAAIYVAEHAPAEKRGFYTSFIQAAVVGGFVLSLVVVLGCRFLIPEQTFAEWGWRVPFLLSIVLLAISLWMRLKLNESPVFRAMKEEGEISHNPLIESFTYPGNKKRILIAMFGVACGLTIVFYTAFFSTLSFLKGPMRIDDTAAELIVGLSSLSAVAALIWFGHLSDRVGRKTPIVWGYVASLVLIFPLFWGLGALANPGLSEAQRTAPITIAGPDCSYDPLAAEQASECGRLMGELTDKGIPYDIGESAALSLSVGTTQLALANEPGNEGNRTQIANVLAEAGYDAPKQVPPVANIIGIVAILVVFGLLVGATYGPVASLLAEMFPPKIRYSSMSIPYHIGAGYFGGFLPLIAGYIVARSGDIYAGLWYTWVLLVVALAFAWWGLKGGPPRDFSDDHS